MAKFVYNNTKNTSTNYISFKLNYRFHLQVLLKKNVTLYFKSRSTNKLADKLRELMKICYQNLFYA